VSIRVGIPVVGFADVGSKVVGAAVDGIIDSVGEKLSEGRLLSEGRKDKVGVKLLEGAALGGP